LDQKFIFWGISDHFITAPKVDEKLVKVASLMHKFAKRSCIEIFHHERTSLTPLDPKLMCWGVTDRFVTARKSTQKLAELVPLTHKLAKQTHVRFFRNERPRSTPLDPKLMFWSVSDRSVTERKSMQNWLN
jgi:hypothetical protein